MRALVTTLALALLAVPAAAEDTTLDQALKALSAGKYAQVVKLAGTVKPGTVDYPRMQYLLGEAELARRQYAAAERAFQAVLAERPKALPAQLGLGRALDAQKKPAAAEKVFRAAYKAKKRDVQVLRAFGEFLTRHERYPEALPLLETAYKKDGKNPLTVRALCEALLRSGNTKRAGAVSAKLIKQQPKHPMGYFLRGYVLDAQEKDEAAIAAYEKSLALDDTFLDAHKNLAILCHAKNPTYRDIERTKKALKHYKRYFELGGVDPQLERVYKSLKSFLPRMIPGLKADD